MSSKPRARRNRADKKFIEKEEEDNEVGVMDEPVEHKNKIEEKQEDMFDPHKLKQNILLHDHSSNPQVFVDLDDGTTGVMVEHSDNKNGQPTEEARKEEEAANRKQRKRGRREVKKFDDEQEEKEEDKVERPKQKGVFEEEELEEPRKEEEETRKEETRKEEEQSGSGSESEAEEERMRAMVSKKSPGQVSNYMLMHTLMSKAGTNKEERRQAIYKPLQPNQHSFVYFKRYQSGFSECYQAIGEDQRPLLFCENQRGCIGCNYYISLTKEMEKNNPAYLGKLRGNAAGSVYQLYDNGMQPNNDYDRSKFRVSMGYVEYESNFLGMKGPRKLKVVLPKVASIEDFDMFKFAEEESLGDFGGSNVVKLRNKSPRWNERLKSYALNFGGRVKQASIKNFILIDDNCILEEEEKAPNAVVFGKIDDNTFALEFGAPLSLYQAFGIAMSEFDFKLKCE